MASSVYNPWGIAGPSTQVIAPPRANPLLPPPIIYPLGPGQGPIVHPVLGSTGFVHAPGSSGYSPAGRTSDLFPGAQNQTYGLGAPAPGQSPLTSNAGDPSNPFTTLSNVKSPEQAGRIDQASKDYEAQHVTTGAALADFTKQFLAGNPTAAANTAQENAVISGYYDPNGVEATQAALRAEETAKVKAADELALQHYYKGLQSTQLMSGGISPGTGNSYTNRIWLGKNMDTMTTQALAEARQKRTDWENLQAAKLALGGRRTNAMDALAGRALVPAVTGNKFLDEEIARAGGIGNLINTNTFFGVKRPYDPFTEGFIGDNSFGPNSGQRPNAGQPQGRPAAGQPQGNPLGGAGPTIGPNGQPLPQGVAADPNFARQFPYGGYRDQYGYWITPDPVTGQWPSSDRGTEFSPNWLDQISQINQLPPETTNMSNYDPITGDWLGN